MGFRTNPEKALHHVCEGSEGEGGSSVHAPAVLLRDLRKDQCGGLGSLPSPKRGIRDNVDSLKHYPVLGKRLSTYDFEKGGAVLSQVRVTSCANYIVSSRNLLQVS